MEQLTSHDWDSFCRESCREQELALFARRAHRRLGRGFVLLTPDDTEPIYVPWTVGAPVLLLDAICGYDPEHEALVVSQENSDVDEVLVSLIRIESHH